MLYLCNVTSGVLDLVQPDIPLIFEIKSGCTVKSREGGLELHGVRVLVHSREADPGGVVDGGLITDGRGGLPRVGLPGGVTVASSVVQYRSDALAEAVG